MSLKEHGYPDEDEVNAFLVDVRRNMHKADDNTAFVDAMVDALEMCVMAYYNY